MGILSACPFACPHASPFKQTKRIRGLDSNQNIEKLFLSCSAVGWTGLLVYPFKAR